jgi:metal-responsive CopG/Arc/MetJ family transcriptional regulator
MKKSIYSLVLADEIIEAIDALAYRQNTSRSNLINQILANSLSLTTEQDQRQEVFERMLEVLDNYHPFKVSPQHATGIFNIKSVLKYKYNPTIRYAITLFIGDKDRIGEVKMVSRSQNETLQKGMNDFFALWSQWERKCNLPGWNLEETGRWVRELTKLEAKAYTESEVAMAITHYLKALDEAMKSYCEQIENPVYAKKQVYDHFSYYIQHTKMLV